MTTTVYRYYDESNRLLYVGITGNQYSRIEDHAKNRAWWREVSYGRFVHYESREKALDVERDTIAQELPKYNKAGPTIEPVVYQHLVDVLQESYDDEWHSRLNQKYDELIRDVCRFSKAPAAYQLVFAFDNSISWDDDGNDRIIDCEECRAVVESKWFSFVRYESDSICDEWVPA